MRPCLHRYQHTYFYKAWEYRCRYRCISLYPIFLRGNQCRNPIHRPWSQRHPRSQENITPGPPERALLLPASFTGGLGMFYMACRQVLKAGRWQHWAGLRWSPKPWKFWCKIWHVFWDFEVYSHFCKANKDNSKKSYMNIQCLEYSSLFSANNWDDLWQIACGSATKYRGLFPWILPLAKSDFPQQRKRMGSSAQICCAGAGVGLVQRGSGRFRRRFRKALVQSRARFN